MELGAAGILKTYLLLIQVFLKEKIKIKVNTM